MLKLALALLTALTLPALSSAKEVDLIKEVKKRTQALAEYQDQRRDILDTIYQIQKEIKSIAKTQTEITSKSQRLQVEMSKSEAELEEMEQNLAVIRQRLGKSALLLSHVDAGSMMKILFAAQSPAELDRTIKFFELIIQREMKVVRSFQAQVRDITAKQEEIHSALLEIQQSEQEMISMEKKLKEEHDQKLSLISKLDKRRQREIESLRSLKLKSLRQIAAELDRDQVIAEFLRPSFLEQKGHLSPPLAGQVLGTYGLKTDAELKTQTSLGGWFIASESSHEVRAPFEGKIARIYQDSKLKNVMIIDHGHDYYTTYSNLRELIGAVGDSVAVDQLIGYASYSPRWRAVGVHFEIRHFSEALDPSKWLLTGKSVQKQASVHEQR